MQILIWKNGRWCPFPEEELRRLRRLAGEGAILSREAPSDDRPRARRRKEPSPTRPAVKDSRSKRNS